MNKIVLPFKRGLIGRLAPLAQHRQRRLDHHDSSTTPTPVVVVSHDPAEGLSADQREIYEMASKFAKTRMRPLMADWDKREHFPVDVLREAGALGLASIYCKPEFGGTGLTRFDASLVFEALAEGCVSTAAYISIHNMCSWMIDEFGSDELRDAWIGRLASMDVLASYCITEPDNGSDASSLKTSAVRTGDYYTLNGESQHYKQIYVHGILLF